MNFCEIASNKPSSTSGPLQSENTENCKGLSELDRTSYKVGERPQKKTNTKVSKRLKTLLQTLELFLDSETLFTDTPFDEYQKNLSSELAEIEEQVKLSGSVDLLGELELAKALEKTMEEASSDMKEYRSQKYTHQGLFVALMNLSFRPGSLSSRAVSTAMLEKGQRNAQILRWQSIVLQTKQLFDTNALSDGARRLFEKSAAKSTPHLCVNLALSNEPSYDIAQNHEENEWDYVYEQVVSLVNELRSFMVDGDFDSELYELQKERLRQKIEELKVASADAPFELVDFINYAQYLKASMEIDSSETE